MTNSTRSSSTSAVCRLEWRPSRWGLSALVVLSLSAPVAVLASQMPRAIAWLLAGFALVHGGWLVVRERGQPRRQLVWPAGTGPVTVDGEPVAEPTLQWRGPLAFLQWREHGGGVQRLVYWPDTLPAARRRELKLAAQGRAAALHAASMAP